MMYRDQSFSVTLLASPEGDMTGMGEGPIPRVNRLPFFRGIAP
jgi:hypothetical protein